MKCLIYIIFILNFSLIAETNKKIDNLWFDSKAEVASYDLTLLKYNEYKKGVDSLIFVTEEFDKKLLVKADTIKKDNLKILKLNHIRKFNTGIYDYTIMRSVFNSLENDDFLKLIKMTQNSIEWCGNYQESLYLKNKNYIKNINSYFQTENIQSFKIKDNEIVFEDSLLSLVKFNKDLNQNKVYKIFRSSFNNKSQRIENKTEKLNLTIRDKEINVKNKKYNGTEYIFQNKNFKYLIFINNSKNREIVLWEIYDKLTLIEKASLRFSNRIDYWNRLKNADLELRKEYKVE